jgi:hypothetical protein
MFSYLKSLFNVIESGVPLSLSLPWKTLEKVVQLFEGHFHSSVTIVDRETKWVIKFDFESDFIFLDLFLLRPIFLAIYAIRT